MAGVYDPATLVNLATLHLHVPPTPPQHDAPPSTSLHNSGLSADEAELQEQETDAWVSAIARAEEREQAYYDETLPFYLLIRLPTAHPAPPLNRAQAASFLLPSLQAQHGSQPHLSLSADVSYIEGAPTPAQTTGFQPASAHHQKRNSLSSSSALGRGPPPSSSSALPARRGSLPALDLVHSSTTAAGAAPKVPLTPSPFPSTRATDSQYASTKEGVSLWSYVFSSDGTGAREDSREDVKGKGKAGARVWVGREQVEGGGEGDWIGVWEFGGDVAFVRTPLTSPRLCLTITATLRDDPRLADLLERARTPTSHSRSPSGVNGAGKTLEELMAEEDEYLVESFDDVNLLSSLSGAFPSSQPLHLPASRLPLPTSSTSTASHPRRSSRSSISLPPGSTLPPLAADAPLHPSIRRAVRRVLNVKSALNVRMRTVPCSVEGLGRRKGASEDLGSGIGMEGGAGGEGLIMCVEVEGGSTSPDESPAGDQEDAFEIESVSVEMTNGSSTSSYTGDVEIREILGERTSSTFPLLLGAQEQHNFLYAVTFSSEAAQLASLHHGASLDLHGQPPSFEPVPIGVATSPSQRFTARFGEEPTEEQKRKEEERQRERERAHQVKESPWLRGVAIVVKGRPMKVSGSGRGVGSARSEGRSLMDGYSVDDAAPSPTTARGEPTIISPTDPFSSRWNCTLDISPFAQRSPPKRASFIPPVPIRPTSTHFAAALARLSVSSAPFPSSPASKRTSRAEMAQVEAVAGSKRHTMASLASLASKSPVLVQRGFKRGDTERPRLSLGPLPPRLTSDTRALPPTPFDVQTPGATGPPRRFFSLPPGAGSDSPYSTPGQHQSFSSLTNESSPLPPSHANLPPTPAYPPHSSARNSLPHADPLNRRFDVVSNSDPKRESWNTAVMAPGFEHGVGAGGGGRDWNVSPANSVGLGFDGAGAGVPTDADLDQIVGGRGARPASGNIVVSISLIPLRTVKSQRPPPVDSTLTPGSDSLSSPEVNLHAGRLSPHATFQFPSAPSSPNPSNSPEPSSNDQSATPTPPSFITERRRSSSIYPSPAAAPKAKAPRPRAPRIGLLDVFLVEVFIVNRGDEVKRFTVGVPVKRLSEGVEVPPKGDLGLARGLGAGLTAEGRKREERVAKIVALENDVRIGPLAPNTCASVRLRFLAIRPGAHTLDELRLVDLGSGLETRLRNPLSVVVEG